MTENTPSKASSPPQTGTRSSAETAQDNAPSEPNPTQETWGSQGGYKHRNMMRDTHNTGNTSSVSKEFKGANPKIGGVLALRSKNITTKASYDIFCEKLETFIMNEFENEDDIFEVIKDLSIGAIEDFKLNNKPDEATEDEKKLLIDMEIKQKKSKTTLRT